MSAASKDLLEIKSLTVKVAGTAQVLVRNANISVKSESILALVGGSGSGKTTTGIAILGLLPPALRIVAGKIIFQGQDLTQALPSQMRALRGKEIGMVFQEPLSAFNPVFTIGSQLQEVLDVHEVHAALSTREKWNAVLSALAKVEISDPGRIARSYPHQLSGGLRQRAMIAQAITAQPKLLIADEPTSNLDVTIHARIIALFKKLREELKLSILLITHDLGMVQHLADEVAVMQEGEIVEAGPTGDVLGQTRHPYTAQLMKALNV